MHRAWRRGGGRSRAPAPARWPSPTGPGRRTAGCAGSASSTGSRSCRTTTTSAGRRWQATIDRLAPGRDRLPRPRRADRRPGRAGRRASGAGSSPGAGAAWWFARGSDSPLVARDPGSGSASRLTARLAAVAPAHRSAVTTRPYLRLTRDGGTWPDRSADRPPGGGPGRPGDRNPITEVTSMSTSPSGDSAIPVVAVLVLALAAAALVGAGDRDRLDVARGPLRRRQRAGDSAGGRRAIRSPASSTPSSPPTRRRRHAGGRPTRTRPVAGLRRLAAARRSSTRPSSSTSEARGADDDPARPRHGLGRQRDVAVGRRDRRRRPRRSPSAPRRGSGKHAAKAAVGDLEDRRRGVRDEQGRRRRDRGLSRGRAGEA